MLGANNKENVTGNVHTYDSSFKKKKLVDQSDQNEAVEFSNIDELTTENFNCVSNSKTEDLTVFKKNSDHNQNEVFINLPSQNLYNLKSFCTDPVIRQYDLINEVNKNPHILPFGNTPEILKQIKKSKPKKHFRSKAVMCRLLPQTAEKGLQVTQTMSEECFAFNKYNNNNNYINNSNKDDNKSKTSDASVNSLSTSKFSKESIVNSSSDYQPSLSDLQELEEEQISEEKELALRTTMSFINKNPKFYIGISVKWVWLIEQLQKKVNSSVEKIQLTLMKIRLNDCFVRLGDQFGLCRGAASRSFDTCVPKLAELLKTFIYFPDKIQCKKLLPIAFRSNFAKLYGITDAFEIQMQKPEKPEEQSLTWSEYKQCNTLKYLICITPDGLIAFVSKGYGGRISDTLLFEDCKIMEVLPEKSVIMADRGFKTIDTILNRKNCTLYRPPSVSSSSKPCKEDVILTKRIASLRIHVERAIRRIREYNLLAPHSTLHHTIMPIIDNIVMIAAALVNVQDPIIKT